MNFSKLIIGTSISLLSATAFADAPNLGFPLGEKSRLHTNLAFGMGYDTNPTRLKDGAVGGIKSRVSPSVAISVPGSAFSLGLNGGVNVDQFLDSTPCGGTGDKTGTCLGGFAGFSLRGGSSTSLLGFEVDGGLVATPTDLFAPPVASADGTTSNEVRLMSDLGVDEIEYPAFSFVASPSVILRPGGGALSFRLGYATRILTFEGLGQENKHGGTFEAKLRFLPRTAVVMNGDFSTWTGGNENSSTSHDASPYNVTVGLRGQLTDRLQANLNAGFGDALNALENLAQQSPIARTSIRYIFAEEMSLSLGYDRFIENAIRVGSYQSDRGNLKASFRVAERMNLALATSYELRNLANGETAQLALAGVRADYDFFDFLNAGLNYQFASQAVDETSASSANTEPTLQAYTRQVFMFVLGLKY